MDLFETLGNALKPETQETQIYTYLNSLSNSEIWKLHTTTKCIRVGIPISLVSKEVQQLAKLHGFDVVKFSHAITGLAIDYQDSRH